ncbi:MAG: EF-hand domain-containing protein [Thermomonas sp.]
MNNSMKNNSMKKMQVLTIAVALALTTAAAFAQVKQAAPDRAKQRIQLDTNKDGVIDRAEAAKMPRLAERFDQLDSNKDGKLSADEHPQMGGKHRRGAMGGGHGRMMALDTDKDGRVNRTEAAAGKGKLAERFDQMDVNKDGFLDKADMQARQSQRRAEFFEAADANHDGALTRAEFDAFKPEGKGMGHGKGHGMGDAKAQTPKP